MILIDGLILSSCNGRFKVTDDGGSLLLGEMDLRALERYFPGVGVRPYGWEIVQVPPRLFSLTVTENDKAVLELTRCEFAPPGPFATGQDGEMGWIHFKSVSDNHYCGGCA